MLRTLVVTSTFPQHEGDFRGAFLRTHWEGQSDEKHRVRVLVPQTRWVEGELDTPLEVRRFRYAPQWMSSLTGRFGILENLRESPRRALLVAPFWAAQEAAIRQQLERFMPHRVVAHFFLPAGLSVARACAGRVPYEIYGHGTDVDLLMKAPWPLRQRLAGGLERADAVYLPSTFKLKRLCKALDWHDEHPMRRKVGVEMMTHVVPRPSVVNPGEREGYLLFLGRLISQKGVDTLIRALARMPEAPPLVVAGDGPEREALEELAACLGVDVDFRGWVVGDAKQELYARARGFVLPSRHVGVLGEGAPLVLAEAHAAGCPIVASDLGGVRELVSRLDAKAKLVPPEDPVALARALEGLMTPAGLRVVASG